MAKSHTAKRYSKDEKQRDLVIAMADRGWTQSRTAKFLGITATEFGKLVNLTAIPKTFSEELADRLFELTYKFTDELFPVQSDLKEESLSDDRVMAEVDCYQLKTKESGIIQLITKIDCPELSFDFELKAELDKVLKTLTPREEKIVRMRYFEDMTLEEVGAKFKVTRNRVRQIEAKALRKLRHPKRTRVLKVIMEF